MKSHNDKVGDLAFVEESFENSQIAFCVDYLGLTVSQVTNLRVQLNQVGAEAKVVKNTLAKLAATKCFKESSAADLEKFNNLFTGPSMLVFGKEDAVSSAKVIAKFAKENEKLSIKGGWFANKFIDETGVEAVSKMPSREEVLGQLLALINTPATQLLRLMNTPARQVVQVIEAQRQKLS